MVLTRAFVALSVLGLVLSSGAPAAGRTVHVRCADGDPSCDGDGRCNDVCSFSRCGLECRVALCTSDLRACAPPGADGGPQIEVPLPKRGRGRRVARVGSTRFVLRCLRAESAACAAEPAGCRADLAEDACRASGGDYDQRGLSPVPSCHCRTHDAGAPCARAGDCEGMCIVGGDGDPAPHCSAHVTEFGCFTILDRDGDARALCVD